MKWIVWIIGYLIFSFLAAALVGSFIHAGSGDDHEGR